MERTLSVRHTGILKFVLPPLWIGLAGYAIWQVWARPEQAFNREVPGTVLIWLLSALFAASLVVLFAFVIPLKRVRLIDDGLRVSNYRREVTIPFRDIARVRQNWLPTFRLITVDLRTDTPLGRRFIFMPAGAQRFAFWRPTYRQEDRLLGELRQLAGLP
jgi:hypothetical protein